ncbi:MAG: hypothetical protein ACE5DI_05630 [Candidatus Micrarchaeia archaeon]
MPSKQHWSAILLMSLLFIGMFSTFTFANEDDDHENNATDSDIKRKTTIKKITETKIDKNELKERFEIKKRLAEKTSLHKRLDSKIKTTTKRTINKCQKDSGENLKECVKNLGAGIGSGNLEEKCNSFKGEKKEVCLKHLARFSESCSDISDEHNRKFCLKAIETPLKNCQKHDEDERKKCLQKLDNIKCDDVSEVHARVLCLQHGKNYKKVQKQRLKNIKDEEKNIKINHDLINAIKKKHKNLSLLKGKDKEDFKKHVLEKLNGEYNKRIHALYAIQMRAESEEALVLVDEMIDYMEGKKEEFKATNSTQEKKSIIAEVNEKWRNFKKQIHDILLKDKIRHAAQKALDALERIDNVIAKLNQHGYNTTKLEEMSSKISEKINAVLDEDISVKRARWRLSHLHKWIGHMKAAIHKAINNRHIELPEDKTEPVDENDLFDNDEDETPTPQASEEPSATPVPTEEPTATPQPSPAV